MKLKRSIPLVGFICLVCVPTFAQMFNSESEFGIQVKPLKKGKTVRISVGPAGEQGSGGSTSSSISKNGQFVAYVSGSSNLVQGDTNGLFDIFIYNRKQDRSRRISVGSGNTQSNDHSFEPTISDNGRIVAFLSNASNLVEGDTNLEQDVFTHDCRTGRTVLVSKRPDGTAGGTAAGIATNPTVSGDGRYVAYVAGGSAGLVEEPSIPGLQLHIHILDRITNQTSLIQPGDGGALANKSTNSPSLSKDGRYIAFATRATNLNGLDENSIMDIYVHDSVAQVNELVSVGADGSPGFSQSSSPSLSNDGRVVAFLSEAPNLVPEDSNGLVDAFVRDLQTGVTERVSIGETGEEANGPSASVQVSPDGRYVAFSSVASNLDSADSNDASDVFLYDRRNGKLRRLSLNSKEQQGDGRSIGPAVSGKAKYLAFSSESTNLVRGDTNFDSERPWLGEDVFLRRLTRKEQGR